MQAALTIGGFDPSSGAGVTADLMVFAAHGIFGLSCITALTVQSTMGVRATEGVPAAVIRETLSCIEDDIPPAGIKLGMLGTADAVSEVATFLDNLRSTRRRVPVVLDPVLRSTSGWELLEPRGVDLLREALLPLVNWITPNIIELGILTGRADLNQENAVNAARQLQRECPGLNVVVTGGDLVEPVDLVVTAAGEQFALAGERIDTRSTHGTGCAFASALLARLLLGDSPHKAARAAKDYVTEAIRTATPIGHGIGPINHLWPLRRTPEG